MERRVGKPRAIPQEQAGRVSQTVIAEIPTGIHRHPKRATEVFLRNGRGLTRKEIGDELGITLYTVMSHGNTERMRRETTTMGVIVSMVNEGLITPAELTEDLNFDRYSQLTDRERETLDLFSQEDMWDMGNKEIAFRLGIKEKTLKNNLCAIRNKLGIKNNMQLIVYRLLIPEEKRTKEQNTTVEREISDQELQILTLKARGFANKQIGQELGITERTVRNRITHIFRLGRFNGTIDTIATLIGNEKLDTSVLIEELDFSRYDLLTVTEKRLLKTLTESRDVYGNKGLAYELNMRLQKVKNHLTVILSKLGVRNRSQAAAFELLRPKPTDEVESQPTGEFHNVYVATSSM